MQLAPDGGEGGPAARGRVRLGRRGERRAHGAELAGLLRQLARPRAVVEDPVRVGVRLEQQVGVEPRRAARGGRSRRSPACRAACGTRSSRTRTPRCRPPRRGRRRRGTATARCPVTGGLGRAPGRQPALRLADLAGGAHPAGQLDRRLERQPQLRVPARLEAEVERRALAPLRVRRAHLAPGAGAPVERAVQQPPLLGGARGEADPVARAVAGLRQRAGDRRAARRRRWRCRTRRGTSRRGGRRRRSAPGVVARQVADDVAARGPGRDRRVHGHRRLDRALREPRAQRVAVAPPDRHHRRRAGVPVAVEAAERARGLVVGPALRGRHEHPGGAAQPELQPDVRRRAGAPCAQSISTSAPRTSSRSRSRAARPAAGVDEPGADAVGRRRRRAAERGALDRAAVAGLEPRALEAPAVDRAPPRSRRPRGRSRATRPRRTRRPRGPRASRSRGSRAGSSRSRRGARPRCAGPPASIARPRAHARGHRRRVARRRKDSSCRTPRTVDAATLPPAPPAR